MVEIFLLPVTILKYLIAAGIWAAIVYAIYEAINNARKNRRFYMWYNNRGLITSGEGQELDIQKAHFIYTFYV